MSKDFETMDSLHHAVLDRNSERLREYFGSSTVSYSVFTETSVLTETEVEVVTSHTAPEGRYDALLELLAQRGNGGYSALCGVLEKDTPELKKQLDETKEEVLQDASSVENSIVIDTDVNFNYISLQERGVDVSNYTFFCFHVRANHNVHVSLHTNSKAQGQMYEIVLGGWKNTKSVIRNSRGGQNKVELSHQPLDPGCFRPFWITWRGGKVCVGAGEVLGEGELMSWQDPTPHAVNNVSISTDDDSSGKWLIFPSPEKTLPSIRIDTPNQYNYQPLHEAGLDISGTTSITFQVRANNDAHVALLERAGDVKGEVYEIVLGGWRNTKSVIRQKSQGKEMAGIQMSPLCTAEFRDIWISWKGGVVAVGRGKEVGKDEFMTWTDPTPNDVGYISVTTGYGGIGSWRFFSPEPILVFPTDASYQYKPTDVRGFQLMGHTSFVFWVKAKNDAHIALLSNKSDTENNMYEIAIGGWRNTKSVIRKKKQSDPMTFALHDPLSGNQYQPFWISFHDGRIAVGEGTETGYRQFMAWTDPSPTDVRFVSVATGWGATGSWMFRPFAMTSSKKTNVC